MRKIFVCLLLTLFVFSVQSQDKITTTNNETILCRILNITPNRIFYEQKNGNKISGKFIAIDEVASYTRQEETTNNVLSNDFSRNQRRIRIKPEHSWLLSLSVGGSTLPYILNSMSSDFPSVVYEHLESAIHLNASVHYLFANFMCVGIQYSLLDSQFEGENYQLLNTGYPIYLSTNSRISQYINFVGPSFLFRQYLSKKRKIQLTETLSGGLVTYRNEEQSTIDTPSESYYNTNSYNILATGRSIGANIGLSAEYFVLPYLSIGVGGNCMYGLINKMSFELKSSDGSQQQTQNSQLQNALDLTHFDYSLVFRFHL